ncbi:MAG TPA: hypothetical protein VGW75_09830 [Solirubrobacteraceae bacterium]|jgi:hypothetical protein|nr:hypothetical protein [Solirubrobacteraceae bacterium]
MPRFPRLGRGEQDAPPEPHAAEQTQPEQQTQKLTSGDPLAAPAPDSTTHPAPHDVTSGDPLTGAGSVAGGAAVEPAATAESPVGAEGHATEEAPTGAAATDAAESAGGAVPEPGASADARPPAGDAPLWSAPGAGDGADATSTGEAPTAVVPPLEAAPPPDAAAAEPAADGAAVVEQAPADATPSFRERTRLRRRMRELRRLREIAFRDLGGLTFELHRFGRDRGELVAAKLEALQRMDSELRAIEVALDARRPLIELREPGIASCPRCATIHGTDANFCPGCGTPLRGSVVGEAGPLRVTPVDNPPGAGS